MLHTHTAHIIYLSGKLHHKSVGPDGGKRKARKMPAKLMFFLLLLLLLLVLLYLTVAAAGVAVAVVVAIFSRFALTTTTATATSWEHFAMLNILELLAKVFRWRHTAKCPSNNNNQQLPSTSDNNPPATTPAQQQQHWSPARCKLERNLLNCPALWSQLWNQSQNHWAVSQLAS